MHGQQQEKQQREQRHERNLLGNLSVGSSVDLEPCYANLRSSDSDGDGKLSPEEFMNFVQISADGKLDKNQYGAPIAAFYMLPQKFIGLYNYFACGDSNYGCPSVEGISIAGVAEFPGVEVGESSEQQEALLFLLCKTAKGGIEKLTEGPATAPALEEAQEAPTSPPTPTITTLPPCPPLYNSEKISYAGGSIVSIKFGEESGTAIDWIYQYYQCKPLPQAERCEQAAHKLELTPNWAEVWKLIGKCDGAGLELGGGGPVTSSAAPLRPQAVPGTSETPTQAWEFFPTRPPTAIASSPAALKPTSSQVATLLPTGARAPPDATSMPPTAAADGGDDGGKELYSGSLFVLFQYEIYNTRNLDAESIATGSNPDNDIMAVLLHSTTVFVEGVVVGTFVRAEGFVHAEGQKRRVRGPRRKHRGSVVLLPPASVSISDIAGVECSTAQQPASSACQKVTVVTTLTLTEEPTEATLLRVQNAIDVALKDPGITFLEDSGIVYAGPMSDSKVIITQPIPGKSKVGGESRLGWAVPVSIFVATLGLVVLLLFVGARWCSCCLSDHAKRRRTGKAHDSRATPRSAPEGDLREQSGLRSIDNQIGPNPFREGDSDSVTDAGSAMSLAWDSSTTSRVSSLSSHPTKDIYK